MGSFTELSLFSGGGGGLLATKHLLGWTTVCYVEKDKLAQLSLIARIKDGLLDDAPIWDDVTTFSGRKWRGLVDVISAGFPCQPYSKAGKKLGAADKRNLWPDTIRIIREVKPEWVLLENVSSILSFDYVGRIFGDLAKVGFDYRWSCISAFDVGASHLRERLWIVAHANNGRRKLDADVRFCEGKRWRNNAHGNTWWQTEPALGRMADGLARGVGQQLRTIGNGQVPAVVARAWESMTINTEVE